MGQVDTLGLVTEGTVVGHTGTGTQWDRGVQLDWKTVGPVDTLGLGHNGTVEHNRTGAQWDIGHTVTGTQWDRGKQSDSGIMWDW